MIRNITEREIVTCTNDLENVISILAEFNVDVVNKYYTQTNKNIVKLLVISEPSDFEALLKWVEVYYNGTISVYDNVLKDKA